MSCMSCLQRERQSQWPGLPICVQFPFYKWHFRWSVAPYILWIIYINNYDFESLSEYNHYSIYCEVYWKSLKSMFTERVTKYTPSFINCSYQFLSRKEQSVFPYSLSVLKATERWSVTRCLKLSWKELSLTAWVEFSSHSV